MRAARLARATAWLVAALVCLGGCVYQDWPGPTEPEGPDVEPTDDDDSSVDDDGDDDDAVDDDDSTADDDDTLGDDDDATLDDDDTPDDDDDASEEPCSSGGSGGALGFGSGSAAGASYTSYVPASAPTPLPVVFTQHGQGGTGDVMVELWADAADAGGFAVIGQDSQGAGWNFSGDVTGLDGIVSQVASDWDVDLCRLYLHGYSAGAHWTYVIGLANADIFAGLAVFAGAMVYAEDLGVWPGGVPRAIGVRIDHGTDDSVVPYSFAEQAATELQAAGHPVVLSPAVGGGHAYDPSLHGDIWASLSPWTLP